MSESRVGNLGGDPELGFAKSGKPVCKFSIAEYRGKDDDGNERPSTWWNCVCFGPLAENVAASLVKGDRVIVSGRIDNRQYETEAGEKRVWTEIVCDSVGPDLRFHTIDEGAIRKVGGGRERGPSPDEYDNDPPRRSAQRTNSRPARNEQPAYEEQYDAPPARGGSRQAPRQAPAYSEPDWSEEPF